jgi:hypothetical protein
LFVDHIVHVILRAILEDCADPFRLRAAELLFRTQRISLDQGSILAADEETVAMRRRTAGLVPVGSGQRQAIELDLLTEANAQGYWVRSDRFDLVLDLGFTRPGLDALCRVLEAWVGHFFGVGVAIAPVGAINDERWVWHIGLDAEATAILNDLYGGQTVDEARLARILSLFRLDFHEPSAMRPSVAKRPVYLALAMNAASLLRLKPQNLLVNLPLAAGA